MASSNSSIEPCHHYTVGQKPKAGAERNLPSQVKLSNETGKPCNLYANNGYRVQQRS